ncbi:MAG TPA: hypothetical protein VNL77_13470 [Roseiflexaceae bacterium]|nr:hypothetical protein [Roseiflexaceae bacterium]
MQTQLTLVAPLCACCPNPVPLIPRDDLPGGLAACPATGQLYRPEGQRWAPATLPPLAPARAAPSVRIDLSRSGYA